MNAEQRTHLRTLIRSGHYASLGTLIDGAPFVSLVLYAPSTDLASFFIHLSRLALHTQNINADPRASLMISAAINESEDPQTLARVSIQGTAGVIEPEADRYTEARSSYLAKNPQTEGNFHLGDFALYEIRPHGGRLVAGFGRIFDLSQEDFLELASNQS